MKRKPSADDAVVASVRSRSGEGKAAVVADPLPGRRFKSEPLRKGAQNSYKSRGKEQKQEELFPKLLAEIEKKRNERTAGKSYIAEERFGQEFRAELAKLAEGRVGGTEEEKRDFFDRIIAAYPDVFWIDGCPAPTVRDKLVHFRRSQEQSPRRDSRSLCLRMTTYGSSFMLKITSTMES